MVIAVIGVLSAILIPSIGAVRKKASSAHSVSNLRQIAAGIKMFANDNGGNLPGPVQTGQGPRLAQGNIANLIKDYIGEENSEPTGDYAELLIYPAWRNAVANEDAMSYIVNREAVPGFFPLGKTVHGRPEENLSPVTLLMLGQHDIADVVWFSEADQQNPRLVGREGWFGRLPEKAVHGDRNLLHYDGSVTTEPAIPDDDDIN